MKLHSFKRKRVSSFQSNGGNADFKIIKPGKKKIIFDIDGPGCINHIWTTQMTFFAPFFSRHVIIRMWWDDEEEPSVECPLGDFFGLGHGEIMNFNSLPMQMSPQKGKGMNCWWPMPFKKHAKIEIENDNPNGRVLDPEHFPRIIKGLYIYYYIDYEIYPKDKMEEIFGDDTGYFHCNFHKVDYLKDQIKDLNTGKKLGFISWQASGGLNQLENGGYDRNHVILHAKGKGQYVGAHIDVDNRLRKQALIPGFNWPGEGDDMIFIDDDVGQEPTLYGTGSEDYVNTAFCPEEKFDGLYHGVIKGDWSPFGKLSYYRYHVLDPIPFEREILVTIEHGHNNLRGDIWETTAYWYQLEPHYKFPNLPNYKERMPRSNFPKNAFNFLKKCIKIGFLGVLVYILLKNIAPVL